MYPNNNNEANIQYCEQAAENMYPKIYKDMYPYVKGMCDQVDNPNNPMMFPFPNEESINNMVKDVTKNYKENSKMHRNEDIDDQYRINGRDLDDLARILLLRELVGRRRRFFGRRRPFIRRRFFGGPFGGYGGPFDGGFFY